MTTPDTVPLDDATQFPQVVVLEAEPGTGRRALLEQWRDAAGQGPAWRVTCDLEAEGPWSGLRELVAAVVPEARRLAPHLLTHHDYELLAVLPSLRRELKARYTTLTDGALSHEKVRNFPADRVFRIAQGLVDLMAGLRAQGLSGPWFLAVDGFDRAGALVQHFFLELLRRRGSALELTLVLAVAPGQAEPLAARLPRDVATRRLRRELSPDAEPALAPDEATRLAEALEPRLLQDPVELEMRVPELLRYWRASGRREPLVRTLLLAFRLTNHYGLYEDARRYGDALTPHLDWMAEHTPDLFWTTVGNLFNSDMALRATDRVQALAEQVRSRASSAEVRIKLFYTLGMLHGRFLPKPDLALAERYLEQGMEEIAHSGLPEEERVFLGVFNRNALAFVRHRQGRPEDAIALCRNGYADLEAHLRPDQHRLHRSVLLYNIAQVLAGIGSEEAAIAHYTAAIEMDPHYSEYFNERGSVFLRRGEWQRALEDLHRAIELSPPYAEVHINLGQCLRAMGRMGEAAEAYSRALDLDPSRLLALLGRAQAREESGQLEGALADYTAALSLKPDQPLALANRALLHYSLGRPQKSLKDLDAAIALAPTLADLYTNRAAVLAELERRGDAIRDLNTYLEMSPTAADREDVRNRLNALLAVA